jgi:hypothetical protein
MWRREAVKRRRNTVVKLKIRKDLRPTRPESDRVPLKTYTYILNSLLVLATELKPDLYTDKGGWFQPLARHLIGSAAGEIGNRMA